MAEPSVVFLGDGAQPASAVGDRLVAFIAAARHSLDIALYDAYFGPDTGVPDNRRPDAGRPDAGRPDAGDAWADRILDALNDAEGRGVRVRAVFNDDDGPHRAGVPDRAGPSFLTRLQRAVPSRGVDGRFELMHHKFVVRDGAHDETAAVWTGSANWTIDSWTRMENLVVVIPGTDLAAAYTRAFGSLWRTGEVDTSGGFDDHPARLTYRDAPLEVRALFSPGRGREMSQLVARRIGEAGARVRILTPVLTSSPILGSVGEVLDDSNRNAGGPSVRIVVDGPQMEEVQQQWDEDGRRGWKGPMWEWIARSPWCAEKPSRPYAPGPGVRDYMHAKLVVCDDWVLTGSYNCSHSGERNAENLLEIHSAPLADACAAFVEGVFERYRRS